MGYGSLSAVFSYFVLLMLKMQYSCCCPRFSDGLSLQFVLKK